jgi:hypothetical protein
MEEEYRCIICDKPAYPGGFVGSIKDISVSFCRSHVDSCTEKCESCVHAGTCKISMLSLRN